MTTDATSLQALSAAGGTGPQWDSLRAAKASLSQRYIQPRAGAELAAFAAAAAAATSPAPDDNLVGVGLGEKVTGGRLTGVLAVKLLVRVKYRPDQIPAEHLLPESADGHPVDVEEVGTFRRLEAQPAPPASTAFFPFLPNPRLRRRPARPGCSIGFKDPAGHFVMAGTFGALVRRGQDLFVLSNNHVLADENQLPLGSPIFQPGLLDGGNPATDEIARLSQFVKLRADAVNQVDAAIAKLVRSDVASNSILFIGPPQGKRQATVDMSVHKFGRTTDYRVGRVTSVATDVKVGYNIGTLTFADQIVIRGSGGQPFSAGGDSGSLILERFSGKAVGLLFAGSSTHTIANDIGKVLQKLQVTLA